MKVILKQDVAKVGKKGELIEVSDGYGRNFLIGRGLAEEATPGRMREYQEFQKTQKARDDKRQKAAEDTKKKLGGKLVSVKVSAGEGGKLFGSVTSAQVAEALSAQFMVNIDKKDIKLDESIKQAGSYTFRIKLYPGIEAEIDDMYAAGISSFKMYMTYPAMMIGDEAMYHALKKLKEKGGICGVHCENSGVIDALVTEKKAAGEMGVSSHPETRPDFLEAEAVGRLLHIAEAVDIPVIIVHLTSAAALREVEAARKRGQKVYVETCPQYLVLDDSVYYNEDWDEAAKFVCSPPIRKPDDQKALWAALRRGEIQTISTDHCSFTTEQKEMGRADFTKIPGGVPGVETRGEVVYSAGVATRKISLATMCRVLAENPARLYGMFPRKGVLAKGADADIVVYDPQADHVIRAENLLSRAGYTPYEGFVTRGGIEQVWLRGQLMVRGGSVVGECGGKFIPRGKCAL